MKPTPPSDTKRIFKKKVKLSKMLVDSGNYVTESRN